MYRFEYSFANTVSALLALKMDSLRAICQVIFCHPPGSQSSAVMQAQPINFYFTDQTKISTTVVGENSVVQMLGSLYSCIESDYGVVSTRLFRAFRPKPGKLANCYQRSCFGWPSSYHLLKLIFCFPESSTSDWKWRKLCCIPYFVIFLMCFACTLVWIVGLTMYLTRKEEK